MQAHLCLRAIYGGLMLCISLPYTPHLPVAFSHHDLELLDFKDSTPFFATFTITRLCLSNALPSLAVDD